MSRKVILIFIAVVGLLLPLMQGCREFQEVKVSRVKGFRLSKMSQEGMEAVIMLSIKNPNNIGFTIYPSEFDVTFSGIHLGKAKLYKRVRIAADSEKEYEFKLKSSFKDVNLMDLTGLLGGRKMGAMEVKGDLRVGKFFRKIRYPVDVKERVDLSR